MESLPIAMVAIMAAIENDDITQRVFKGTICKHSPASSVGPLILGQSS
jgi:hypothetical protein